jgi:hypothetical protein
MSIFNSIASFFKSTGGKFIPRQIKLNELESTLQQLLDKKLEYDFFGITSNGIDCIYFVIDEGKINIDFEIMIDEQKPFVDKIRKFALDNGFRIVETTYGNKPQYKNVKTAPVYKIEINADKNIALEIGEKIMTSVFNCNESTIFEVVP